MGGSRLLACVMGLVCIVTVSAPGADLRPEDVTDAHINAAIDRAIEFLWTDQEKDGSWGEFKMAAERFRVGPNALVVYALLESGVPLSDERMQKAMRYLRSTPTTYTYGVGFRAQAWRAAWLQSRDEAYLRMLQRDVGTLIRSTRDGSYGYHSSGSPAKGNDNSNSHVGVIGVWAGLEVNLDLGTRVSSYFKKVLGHWLKEQCGDGGWGYPLLKEGQAGSSKPSMTAAGTAALFVCLDTLFCEEYARGDLPEMAGPLDKAMKLFSQQAPGIVGQAVPDGYNLYAVERVAMASGYKFFGGCDWYRTGAAAILNKQREDGAFVVQVMQDPKERAVRTAFGLLFLARGRQPVLFNKLERPGDWRNRPRDLANLTRWITNTFEKHVHWQSVSVDVGPEHWHDAPLLYIAGIEEPKFTDAQLANLRNFVHQGGTIVSVTERDGKAFAEGIRKVYAQLFPDYELMPAAPGHALYSAHWKLAEGKPEFFVLSNGARPLAIHCDADLPMPWQRYDFTGEAWAFQAAGNVFMYATDHGSLRPRANAHWPTGKPAKPQHTLSVMRVKHAGNWNPEPLALERFRLRMARDADTGVQVLDPIDLEKLTPNAADLVFLTGTGPLRLTAAETSALLAYVATGGTVLIDAAGGASRFAESVAETLNTTFPTQNLSVLPPDHEIYTREDYPLGAVRYRRTTQVRIGDVEEEGAGAMMTVESASPEKEAGEAPTSQPASAPAEVLGPKSLPRVQVMMLGKRPGIFFSREDLTVGLTGAECSTIDGYKPESAFRVVRNIALFLADSDEAPADPKAAPTSQPTTQPQTPRPRKAHPDRSRPPL